MSVPLGAPRGQRLANNDILLRMVFLAGVVGKAFILGPRSQAARGQLRQAFHARKVTKVLSFVGWG